MTIAKLLLILLVLLTVGLTSCHHTDRPHSVTLTWQASPSTAQSVVVGYNVYRRTGLGTPYERIASHVPGSPYEDHEVSNRTVYFYAVTAVDQRGRESAFSKVVRVEIP